MPYEINEHRHRFCVWAAARAAQRGFTKVGILRKALEACGVVQFLDTADLDDIDATRFDELHRQWCMSAVAFLQRAGISNVPFGRVAKLIAIYLKCVVVLGPASGTGLAREAHPPIDGILLRNLAASNVNSKHKRTWANIKWTKLKYEQYYELIMQLRQAVGPEEPFWKLERFWTVTNDTAGFNS
jgi:hypothetical protein